jgi:hypothetical protein
MRLQGEQHGGVGTCTDVVFMALASLPHDIERRTEEGLLPVPLPKQPGSAPTRLTGVKKYETVY